MKRSIFFHLTVILIAIVAVALRLWHINYPLADWQSWRQSDTAAVARNFIKFGVDPLRPRFDDLSNIPSGKDNPMGWRMVEFPIYQVIGTGFFTATRLFTIEVWLRLTTIVASVGTLILLSFLVAEFVSPLAGLFSGFIYAVLPYSIFYGRAILPDTLTVFFSVLSLFLLAQTEGKRSKGPWGRIVLSSLVAALALLTKPMAAFLLLPALYLLIRRFSFSKQLVVGMVIYGAIALLPFLWWRQWIRQFSEGIPAYLWLLNAGNIRFKGAWFRWLFAVRLGDLMLGFWGLIPFGLGLLMKPNQRERAFFRWWILGALLYLIIFAAGNVQHDYYQILIVPAVVIVVAKGYESILRNTSFSLFARTSIAVVSAAFMLAFSWFTIRTYYWINRPEIVEAGRLADKLLPKDAKVIAPYGGDTTFLYQTNRQGWPIGFDITKKIKMGAAFYVTVSPTDKDLETKQLAECFTVLVRNDRYAVIDLTKPTKPCTIVNP